MMHKEEITEKSGHTINRGGLHLKKKRKQSVRGAGQNGNPGKQNRHKKEVCAETKGVTKKEG